MKHRSLCLALTSPTACQCWISPWTPIVLRHRNNIILFPTVKDDGLFPFLPHLHRQQLGYNPRNYYFGTMKNAINNNGESNYSTLKSAAPEAEESDGKGSTASNTPSSELEIEKKFPIPDVNSAKKMEQMLTSLGYAVVRREEFVDWYFDLPSPHWHFSLKDCWIRYREKKIKIMNDWGWRGAWQVKRGRKDKSNSNDGVGEDNLGGREKDGMTVYEEVQGKAATQMILEMLSKLDPERGENDEKDTSSSSSPWSSSYDGFDIPYLEGGERLVPFARFETYRTCWKFDETLTPDPSFSILCGLKVDMDKTNFGFMVGEVEAVVAKDGSYNRSESAETRAAVQAEKDKVRNFVDMLTDGNSLTTIGKLEYYMINNRRDHYDACVKAGVMMN